MTKILIVEDDIYLLKLYQEVFLQDGFEVEVAEDGEQALKKALTFLPDVVLLDLMLPYIDGFSVLKELKSDPQTREALVIVATNLDSERQREKAKSFGAAAFLVKSGDTPGNILEGVKKILAETPKK